MAATAPTIGGGLNIGDLNAILEQLRIDALNFENEFAQFYNKLNATSRSIADLIKAVEANLSDYTKERAESVIADLQIPEKPLLERTTELKPDTELIHKQQMIYNAALTGS